MRVFVVEAEDRMVEAEVEVGYKNQNNMSHTKDKIRRKIVQR